MIVEVVLSLIAVIILKAFFESDWVKDKKNTYSRPGIYYGSKKTFVKLYCWIGRALRYLLQQGFQRQDNQIGFLHGDISKKPANITTDVIALCFNGFSVHGNMETPDARIILKVFIRSQNQAELYLYLQVPGKGFLQLPCHPEPLCCSFVNKDGVYRADGLVLEEVEPNRKWKVCYHGEMRLVDTEKELQHWHEGKSFLFVRLNFIWTAYSSIFDVSQHSHIELVSQSIARESWCWNFYRKLKSFWKHNTSQEQWGEIRGRIYVDGMEGGQRGMKLSLRGAKEFFVGSDDGCHRYMKVKIRLEDGMSICVTAASFSGFVTHFVCGYVIYPNKRLFPISDCNILMWRHGEDGNPPKIIQFTVVAESHSYNVVCILTIKPLFYFSISQPAVVRNCFADVFVDSMPGSGVVELYYGNHEAALQRNRQIAKPLLNQPFFNNFSSTKLITLLSERESLNQTLVGTKASNLAKLLLLKDKNSAVEFRILDGFCITKNAYCEFLKENGSLLCGISELKNALKNGSNEEILVKSQMLTASFTDSNLPAKLIMELKENIRRIKNNSNPGLAVILRCSNVEICEENCDFPSFANTTCINQVLNFILKCWASQFSYDTLQYRRRRGIPVDLGMGILVQIMTEEERASGIVTSCQPETGDPSEIIVAPDSKKYDTRSGYFVLSRLEGDTYDVSRVFDQRPIFQKQYSQTNETMVQAHKLLLSNDDLFKLTKISLFIKKCFNHDMKLKWSISARGKISILNARELLVHHEELEEDLIEEFDSAHAYDGHVIKSPPETDSLPLVATPLTMSIVYKSAIQGLQRCEKAIAGNDLCFYSDIGLDIYHGSYFVNLKDVQSSHGFAHFFGENAVEEDVQSNHLLPDRSKPWEALKRIFFSTKLVFKSLWALYEQEKLTDTTKMLNFNSASAQDLYQQIDNSVIPILSSSFEQLVINMAQHQFFKKIVEVVLNRTFTDFSVAANSIFASIYKNVTTKEENIAYLLQELAFLIQGDKEEFLSLKPLKAVDWMIKKENNVKILYEKFLDLHGQHCLNECEMREQSWKDDQTKIITTIQALVEAVTETSKPQDVSVDDVVENIKLPLNFIQSFMLKLVIPNARRALRETIAAKSMFVRNLEVFKRSYCRLSKMLKEEMRVPDADLMYFLSHSEIGKLSKSFSPQLIEKSIRRRHIYSQTKTKKQQESCQPPSSHATLHGSSQEHYQPQDIVLQGSSVSSKCAEGPARIINDESEAFLIQEGEILIIRNLDIGWSPYFPLLAGLVSEAGDVSSAGSILARDFGLPCLVGVQNAKASFSSGDRLYLDISKGTVRRAK